jgi:hypothetical protein
MQPGLQVIAQRQRLAVEPAATRARWSGQTFAVAVVQGCLRLLSPSHSLSSAGFHRAIVASRLARSSLRRDAWQQIQQHHLGVVVFTACLRRYFESEANPTPRTLL